MLSYSQFYRLRYQHETIPALIYGLSDEQMNKAVIAGKWSIQQNIAHLAAYQPMFMGRIWRILNEEDPTFERYVADNDPLFLEACKKNVMELLEQLSTDRQAILNTFLSGQEDALSRTGIHAKFGKMDIPRWLEFFLLHESHHLYTIFMLTADVRTSLHLQPS